MLNLNNYVVEFQVPSINPPTWEAKEGVPTFPGCLLGPMSLKLGYVYPGDLGPTGYRGHLFRDCTQ